MNLPEPIGGYFGLELRKGDFLHSDSILLNSVRNCLEYVLKANNVNHVYIPKYICDVMLEPFKKLNISYSFYSINENLEIKNSQQLNTGDYLLYVNYFGIKDEYSSNLSRLYGDKLILDCSQAFYFEPLATGSTLYSPRKFFGVPDGGMLYTPNKLDKAYDYDISYNRFSHLIKRIDVGAEGGYEDFKKNDSSLINQPIKHMSKLTKNILGNIDYEHIKYVRDSNFKFLHEKLKNSNNLRISLNKINVPMIYPYQPEDAALKQRLIDNKIFVATYWPNIFDWTEPDELERKLATKIIPLPIDQRYDEDDMKMIVRLINGS